jgi:hypothetical protein
MSYARWSHSRWYVFHHIDSGETCDTQLLAIYDAAGPCITLDPESLDGSTNEDLGRFLMEAAKHEGTEFTPATDAELDELRGYIAEWLEDIKTEDPTAN